MTITETLFSAKKEKDLSFADLGKVLGRDEVWIAALFYRQAKASRGKPSTRLSFCRGICAELSFVSRL